MVFLTISLERKTLDRDIDAILSAGVEVKTNISVGTDISLKRA